MPLELEIREIENLLLQKTQEYFECAKQLSGLRKDRYQAICKEILTELIAKLNQQGIVPSTIPNSCLLSAPLTAAEGYSINVVNPREASANHIGEAASSWKHNQLLGTILPCIFITLPQPGAGTTLATRYLSSTGELAPLLAHEIGHLWRFHDHEMNRCIDRWNWYLYITAGIFTGISSAGCWLYGTNHFDSSSHSNRGLTPVGITASCIALLSGIVCLYAKIKQFSRLQELEADQFIAALGDESLEQFVTTLMRWHLNEQLTTLTRPKTLFNFAILHMTSMINYCKKRFFGSHPSTLARLFHLIAHWHSLKIKKLLTLHTESDAYLYAEREISQRCQDALYTIPELKPENLDRTLQVNFPEKIFSEEEKQGVQALLRKALHDFHKVISKALHADRLVLLMK
jgi:hypothetical protein